ncbi:hypothetical protein Lalb_Chr20g0115681 [Lupinus albus]|uniref:Uncharacterized protein n=1 Tax=Lupinus albus TaxID=3870 RepID=A0A6A4NK49_LUPAL|nr:hypothetical protein Lalb_Chr20g0115681 [Lupinus albus]
MSMIPLRPKVPRGICSVSHHLIGREVILIHPTIVYKGRKINNLLMPKHHFQLGLQTRFKLRTFGQSVLLQFRGREKSSQFLELGRIISHRHVTLLQSQKFHFFLPLQIRRKVFLKKLLLGCTPSNHLSLNFHLAPRELPPDFSFLYQHVGSIGHLLIIAATHGSEYPFQTLNPLI